MSTNTEGATSKSQVAFSGKNLVVKNSIQPYSEVKSPTVDDSLNLIGDSRSQSATVVENVIFQYSGNRDIQCFTNNLHLMKTTMALSPMPKAPKVM
uniref:Uncharacterized protein n=1 Tax=Romanomermis culicivorax TaxID=13658 RepID=A0A915IE24_ROMCU